MTSSLSSRSPGSCPSSPRGTHHRSQGCHSLLDQYKADYGTNLPDNPIYGERAGQAIQYVPVMEVTYWGFRMMIGFGAVAAVAALAALWATAREPSPASRGLMRWPCSGSWHPSEPTPPAGSSPRWAGSRSSSPPNPDPSGIDQVFMFTAAAVSPGVSAGELLTSLVVLTAVYAVLLVVEVRLLVKYIRGGVVAAMPELAHVPADGNEDGHPQGRWARQARGRRRRPGLRLLSLRSKKRRGYSAWNCFPPSGSSPSRCCGRATSFSRASTSASGC